MKKQTLLILCDFYLPSVRAGGPVRSISAIISPLKKDFDITVITRDHDIGIATPFEQNQLHHDGYRVLYFSDTKLMFGIREILKKQRFDIIYFNSFVAPRMTIFTLLYLFFKRKPRMIISPRGELGSGALVIKSKRKKIYIAIFKKLFLKSVEFLAASDSEKNEIQIALGKKAKTMVLSNLTTHVQANELTNLKIENNIHIVFLSRISRKKNLLGAIEILSQVKGSMHFDIIGPIEDEPYWNECQMAIKKLPVNIQANYRGSCDPDNVTNTLKSYDLFFLPSWNENYGHVIVESLAVGCPVLLSDQTPWHDLKNNDAGWEYALCTPELFAEKIDQLITLNNAQYNQYKNAALQYYLKNIAHTDLDKSYMTYFRNHASVQ